MSQDNQRRQVTAPIGGQEAKSPQDRIRQIQQMQQAAEAQAVAPQRQEQAAQAQATQKLSTSQATRLPDGFNVGQVQAVNHPLISQKANPAEQAAFARAQASAQALFGGTTDIEVLGNPWKVIPFGDSLPALFDADVAPKDSESLVPKNAVKTEQGLLFEVGVKARGAEAPQKRAVLVDGQGRLAGAECKTPKDAERLLQHAPWLLPAAATKSGASWSVSRGDGSAFALNIKSPSGRGATAEVVGLSNFARPVDGFKKARDADLVVANYHLDRFDAAI